MLVLLSVHVFLDCCYNTTIEHCLVPCNGWCLGCNSIRRRRGGHGNLHAFPHPGDKYGPNQPFCHSSLLSAQSFIALSRACTTFWGWFLTFQDMTPRHPALLSALLTVLTYSVGGVPVVDMDGRSVKINGTRELILSGSVHYARVLPADWERVFLLAKEMNLNLSLIHI